MTTGIYKLIFAPGVEYIGKSINIEDRWDEHQTNLLRNKAAVKMQAAYKVYGMPDTRILAECHKDHIDFLEEYYIAAERPLLNTVRATGSMGPEDFDLVKRNEKLLFNSTIEHLELIEEYEFALDEANNTIEALGEKVIELLEEYDSKRAQEEIFNDLKTATEKYDIMIAKKDAEIKELTARLEKAELPWYKKFIG